MQPTKSGRIDVQFHFSPDFYTARLKQVGGHVTTDGWSVPGALAYMDKYGVQAGILSVSTPGVDFLPPDEAVAMARRLNEAGAEVAAANPGRFGNFATLPMHDVDATLAEIDYCFDVLGMEGVCFLSNVGGRYPGHPDFAPILDALNRRQAVVFIHPTDPEYGSVQMAGVAEWPFDTTRAAIDLMYSGTIKRCPDVAFILAHAGGALPMVARRVIAMSPFYATDGGKPAGPPPGLVLSGLAAPGGAPARVPQTAAEVGGFYYDLAISAHPNALGALRGVTDMDHVLFACDWPYAPDPALRSNVAGFEALDLTPDERAAIEYGTAARLFPKLLTFGNAPAP